MSIWAIIPVKPLSRAKSRLANVLSPQEREQLAETLFRRVVTVVKSVPAIAGTLVISRDTRVMSIARDLGVNTVQESGNLELNMALMRATQVVKGWRSEAVLILPADLPLVAAEDVTALIGLGMDDHSMVIATDSHEDGTNALLIRPPGLIPYTYGPGSFGRHIQAAEEIGANVTVYRSERLMLDIDTPADLEQYYRLSGVTKSLTTGS
ncbi:MAG: 2-phospho-L-lactate guanylyltransferase [Anaerolinea sp.]|nr:2-phospho-L-lactate guanylyltransferase [Anaerolinea sp.]